MTEDRAFKITWDWLSAPTVRAPELRATWASVQIQVGRDFATLVEDRDSGSSRRSIYCPLYPLAEWIAYNWWFLQADSRPTSFLSQDRGYLNPASRMLPADVRERHSIRASGDGFAWPDLLIVPDGAETRLVWEYDRPARSNWPIRFLTRGDIWVSSDFVTRELEHLVTSVLTRLAEQGVTGTVLQKEWNALQETSPEEAEYCRAAARLGLDPYSGAESFEQQIVRASEILIEDLLTDFLDAADPTEIDSALAWINIATRTIDQGRVARRAAPPEAGVVQELRADAPSADSFENLPPWDIGFLQARSVRAQLSADDTEPFAVDRYVSRLTQPGEERWLHAMGGTPRSDPVVVTGPGRRSTSTRFILSRALWHCIWDASAVFMVTSAHTYRQRIERAFAAELLAPADGIATLLKSGPASASQAEMEEVARHFDVSSMVIDHQVRNRLLVAGD